MQLTKIQSNSIERDLTEFIFYRSEYLIQFIVNTLTSTCKYDIRKWESRISNTICIYYNIT